MKMKLWGIVVGLLCVAACSVKEDRMECPCRLVLDLRDVDTSIIKEADVYVEASQGFVFNEVMDSCYLGNDYVMSVPKGRVNVWTYSGAEEYSPGPEGLMIPYGDDCPEVYMHCSSFDALQESAVEKVSMLKNHAVLTVHLQSEHSSAFDIAITGNVNGYDAEGKPSEGGFRYEMSFEDGVGRVVLPRQTDTSLKLEVVDGENTFRVFSFGEYIESSGYDWTRANLEDITMTLDYALSSVGFRINDWEKEYHFDIVI